MKGLLDSASAVESVKHLKPSSLFITILIVAVPLIIDCLFRDIPGYVAMVWIWFIFAIISICVAIWAYRLDMAAYTKSQNYVTQENEP